MRVVVMCGGSGSRLNDYSAPKPLNYIHAKPAITYVLEKVPFQEIDFVVSQHLIPFQFESVIRMHLKHKTCRFHYLPYFTRGPIESAWLGTLAFDRSEEPIVFLDNDVVYTFPDSESFSEGKAFLGYSEDTSGSEAFSFLRVEGAQVHEIQEKKRISNLFGCGVYGFASLSQFRTYAKRLLETPQEKELYMSMVFSEMLKESVYVKGVYFPKPLHIGSLQEVRESIPQLPTPKLRICLDLDNTLVSSPTTAWDYSTVQPIPKMIRLARKWKELGHTIIIHTARRMQTHKNNVGAVIADCAVQTIQTLEKFGIPYDELLFGKPMADVYIDDKALNPYLNSPETFGFFEEQTLQPPINAMPTNKYNQVLLEKDAVVKRGPTKYLAGEIYYHTNIPEESAIRSFFPKMISQSIGTDQSELRTEYIKGIPLAHLWQSQLLNKGHIDTLMDHLRILHNTVGFNKPSIDDIRANYIQKLEERFAQSDQYPFEDADEIQTNCLSKLRSYCENKDIQSVHFIHGDFWFSNILLTFDNKYKFIDMKGICWKTQTTGGDPLYDYAKLYQSFLGYDSLLNNECSTNDTEYQYHTSMRKYYESKLTEIKIDIESVKTLTFALVLGTLPFISDASTQTRVWNWSKRIFIT